MILVLAGPTGSGKSDMAVSLARQIGGAVVNADAFQVYQELGIATAKPSPSMRAVVPHYLFDFVPLTSSYSVFEYQKDLRAVLSKLKEKGVPAIIAGGTGLYLRAGLYDYSFPEEKKVDMSAYEALGDEELYQELLKIDPEEAQLIHPHNRVRSLRAIDVFLSTGRRKSDIKKEQEHRPVDSDVHFFGLLRERAPLYERIEKRVDAMFEEGLVEEDRRLVAKYGEGASAFRAIGVKEMFPYFRGEKSLEECKQDIKTNTRHYIKRQETFFKNQFDIHWIEKEEEIFESLPSLKNANFN